MPELPSPLALLTTVLLTLLQATAGSLQPQASTERPSVCPGLNSHCNCSATGGQLKVWCKFREGLEEGSHKLLLPIPTESETSGGEQAGDPGAPRLPAIAELDLSGSNLSGLSEGFLAGVSAVGTLAARECGLEAVPRALLEVGAMRVLDLSNNRLSAFHLADVASLGLHELRLSSNRLERIVQKGRFPKGLSILRANNNALVQLPPGVWRKLREIEVSDNAIASLPPLKRQSELRRLDLARNNLTELPQDFLGTAHLLQSLDLAGNGMRLPGNVPSQTLNLTQLQHLDLSHNSVGHLTRGLLAHCPRLQSLDLSHNKLTHLSHDHEVFPPHNSHMQVLNLSHNALAHLHPAAFHHLQRLRSLDLSHNPALGHQHPHPYPPAQPGPSYAGGDAPHPALARVAFPEHLMHLDLGYCSLERVDYCQVSRLHDLITLGLDGNPLRCSCSLHKLQHWYRFHSHPKSAGVEVGSVSADWQCLTPDNKTKRVADIVPASCPDNIHCALAEPSEVSGGDVQVTVNVIVAEHNIITSWTMADLPPQIHGFRVLYTHEASSQLLDESVSVVTEAGDGELGGTVRAVRQGVHVSPMLGTALRSYALTDVDTHSSYTVCVDVMGNATRVLKRKCTTVKGSLPNALVGILAGVVFLVPCIIFIIYILVKDRRMRPPTTYQITVNEDGTFTRTGEPRFMAGEECRSPLLHAGGAMVDTHEHTHSQALSSSLGATTFAVGCSATHQIPKDSTTQQAILPLANTANSLSTGLPTTVALPTSAQSASTQTDLSCFNLRLSLVLSAAAEQAATASQQSGEVPGDVGVGDVGDTGADSVLNSQEAKECADDSAFTRKLNDLDCLVAELEAMMDKEQT